MAQFNTSTPSGFPEFTPAQERVRQHWIQVISDVFESNGFCPINTPLVEREENFLAKGGNAKEMYVLKRLLDDDGDASHSGNAVRFDHTVPLALYVARHLNDIKFPFRRYAIGPVMRGERAQKGRFRQFDQCDIDIIGSENLSLLNDALMPAIIIQIFEKLNIGDFVVRINNRKMLTGFAKTFNIDEKSYLDVLDQKEKVSLETFHKMFEALRPNSDYDEKTKEVNALTQQLSKEEYKLYTLEWRDFFKIARTRLEGKVHEEYLEGLDELEHVWKVLKEDFQVPQSRFQYDISIARGLDYYTGTVFETTLVGSENLGSICSGGRYDDLAEVFTGKKLPGVGISIGLTRLLSQLFDAGIVKTNRSSPTDILVLAQDPQYMSEALQLGASLRSSGLRVENYLEPKKIGKQFDYANKLGIPFCAVLGEYEIRDGTVQIKNMSTGEQQTVPREEVAQSLKGLLT
jgi:histidyl-tRNA synthetase